MRVVVGVGVAVVVVGGETLAFEDDGVRAGARGADEVERLVAEDQRDGTSARDSREPRTLRLGGALDRLQRG